MKFLTKINRSYFITLTIVLIISSVLGYLILHRVILDQAKETLIGKANLLKGQISETGETLNLYPEIEIKKINRPDGQGATFKEIFIHNPEEDELEPYLEYSIQEKIGDSFYLIRLRQSIFENEDLVVILALTMSLILLSSFVILFFIGRRINKTIWADFEQNLSEIENFDFSEKTDLHLVNSDIEEFDRLNKVVAKLTQKLKSDYMSLREFAEDASHEIQTPLSIARLSLDEILQQNPGKEIFEKIVAAINALKRLSALNQSLLLLTKIENKQFKADQTISFINVTKRKLEEFDALLEMKKLTVEKDFTEDFSVKMNQELAERLFNNLFSNAIHHNLEGGCIKIQIKKDEFKICNSGLPNSLNNETIFNRFAKGNSKSHGLGLAIVKNICNTHSLHIRYVKSDLHCFTIHPNTRG